MKKHLSAPLTDVASEQLITMQDNMPIDEVTCIAIMQRSYFSGIQYSFVSFQLLAIDTISSKDCTTDSQFLTKIHKRILSLHDFPC